MSKPNSRQLRKARKAEKRREREARRAWLMSEQKREIDALRKTIEDWVVRTRIEKGM